MHALKLRGISKIGIYKKFNIFHDGIYSIFYRRHLAFIRKTNTLNWK